MYSENLANFCSLEDTLKKAISEESFYLWLTPGNPLSIELPRNVKNSSVKTIVMFDGKEKNYGIALEVEDTELYWEKTILSDDEFSMEKFKKEYSKLFEVNGIMENCGTA